ncbi:MAG: hypothetical protein IPL73_26070 [Candidatus Obscuribacter sp.]|nr:hypothetical protein [Candidatus Obscuribacter sp.]
MDNTALSFIESKGTLSSYAAMIDAAATGKKQLLNVKPTNLLTSPRNFAVSTYFAVNPSKRAKKSTCTILDPDGPPGGSDTPGDADKIIRYSYAKVLRYANQDALAELLIAGKSWNEEISLERPHGSTYLPVGLDPFGNFVLLHRFILELLANNEKHNLAEQLRSINYADTQSSKIVLSNGVALLKG